MVIFNVHNNNNKVHNRKNTEIRTLVMGAKVVSTAFRPIYYPVLSWLILFTFTRMSLLPLEYKLMQISILIAFTVALPLMLTLVYRSVRRIDVLEMRKRKSRIVPYLMFIACYLLYLYVMSRYYIPYLLISVVVVALCIQVVCTLLSFFWKVSVHAAGSGAIIGGIAACSMLFDFNPLFWLGVAFLMAGLVGTSRMILRQHSLSQILVGILIGIFCGFFGILRGFLIFN